MNYCITRDIATSASSFELLFQVFNLLVFFYIYLNARNLLHVMNLFFKDPVGKKLTNSTFTGYPSKHAYTIAYIVIIVLYS